MLCKRRRRRDYFWKKYFIVEHGLITLPEFLKGAVYVFCPSIFFKKGRVCGEDNHGRYADI
jgi:hypothetical protein